MFGKTGTVTSTGETMKYNPERPDGVVLQQKLVEPGATFFFFSRQPSIFFAGALALPLCQSSCPIEINEGAEFNAVLLSV